MSEKKIVILDDADALYVHAAEEIAHFAGDAICSHGEFMLCLSGGSTPAATYDLLATRFQHSIDWSEVQFFWGDERCVPPADPASNFAMADRTMLSKLALKPGQVHRIRGELPPDGGRAHYEEELRRAFAIAETEVPRFDVILLGLGENRHTASLFPASPAIHETNRIAVPVQVDDVHRDRVTLTPPVLNNGHRVMFLVAGAVEGRGGARRVGGSARPRSLPRADRRAG